jgi:hypothetical protein
MALVNLKCAFCKKQFSRSRGRFNEAKKFHWKQFCSSQCLAYYKNKKLLLKCANPGCKNSFSRALSQVKKSVKQFCSSSCAAIFNNKQRNKGLSPNFCANNNCCKLIPRNRKYCCLKHRPPQRKFTEKSYKKHIIEKIQKFYQQEKRIPLKREMQGAYKTARNLFGTWNNAIKSSGLKPNPVLFSEKQIANDGHLCDSMAEKIIDDWLSSKKILHQRNVRYPLGTYSADFSVDGKLVEFFGLAGELREYDKITAIKRKICAQSNLPLIEIYPRDLFSGKNLDKTLAKIL